MSALLEAPTLFFTQRAKLIEITNEYLIRDERGALVGVIRQEGQSWWRKLLRFATRLDRVLTHRVGVFEPDGRRVLTVTRPATIWKSTILVDDPRGERVGSIVQRQLFGYMTFSFLDADGRSVGALKAQNWRHWNFIIVDASDVRVGRITKEWAGIGRELFTTADNYLYEIKDHARGTLRILAIASAIGVDLALKQDK